MERIRVVVPEPIEPPRGALWAVAVVLAVRRGLQRLRQKPSAMAALSRRPQVCMG